MWGIRLYLFREGRIHHQTKDHNVPQMLVNAGEITAAEIRHHPDRLHQSRNPQDWLQRMEHQYLIPAVARGCIEEGLEKAE